MKNCHLPHHNLVFSWRRWQESRSMLAIEILLVIALVAVTYNSHTWTILGLDKSDLVVAILHLAASTIWSLNLLRTSKVYITHGELILVRCGNMMRKVFINNIGQIYLESRQTRKLLIFKGPINIYIKGKSGNEWFLCETLSGRLVKILTDEIISYSYNHPKEFYR